MTRKYFPVLLTWTCLFAWGCGEEMPKPLGKTDSPHGGILYEFPNKKGSVEIVSEPAGSTPGASKLNSHRVAAYFYQIDGKTPLSTSPTDVTITIGEPTPIPLKPEEDNEKVGRFASPPGPYGSEVRGTLAATVDGEKVEVSFTKR